MSVKRLVLIIIMGIVSVVVAVSAVILVTDATHETATVAIADAVEPAEDASDVVEASPEAVVTVNADNVQNVIKMMSRRGTYSRYITVTSYWNGGSITSTIASRIDGDNASYVISGKREKHIIRTGDMFYLWYGDSSRVFSSKIDSGTVSDDELQSLVTWEKIIGLPKDNIKSASYSELNGDKCIYVEYVSGELGFKTECYVGIEDGLVLSANTYDGNVLIYSMTSTEPNYSAVAETYFELPDGTNVLNRS